MLILRKEQVVTKKEKIITGLLMSLVMAISISGFFTLMRIGLAPDWYVAWAKAFAASWPVGLVLSTLIATPISRLSARLAAIGSQG